MHHLGLIITIAGAIFATAGCATGGPVDEPDSWPESPTKPWETMSGLSMPGPDGWDDDRPTDRGAGADGAGIFELGYRFYVGGLTRIDGARCEHRPTCSRFTHQAVVKHGVVVGMMLGIDRLMRGDRSSIHRRLPVHSVDDGRVFYHDPVEENDFFLQ